MSELRLILGIAHRHYPAVMELQAIQKHYPAIMYFCRNSPDWRVPVRKELPYATRGTEAKDEAFAFQLDRKVRDAAAGLSKYDHLTKPVYPGPKKYNHLTKPIYS